MSKFISAVRTFVADEDGVTALEYALIASLIAVAIVGTVQILSTDVKEAFEAVSTALNS